MAKSLVIVESPAKAKTIEKILGKDYQVKASTGHVRDLPKKGLGVEVRKNFQPKYEVLAEKKNVVEDLQTAARNAESVFLAPDPDREGEAIAWHLASILEHDAKRMQRIEFNEITKDAILRAIKEPRPIDIARVNAQQARRVLDRLVGYKISPLLWYKVRRGLSAGRVQSVAVRMICDREEEVRSFVPKEYWSIGVSLVKGRSHFLAEVAQLNGKKIDLHSGTAAEAAAESLRGSTYAVKKVTPKEQKRQPSPPYITSTLQQEGSRRYGFSVKRTMALAQQLYEGIELGTEGPVGLITYMRTDSVRVAQEAQDEAREYVTSRFGKEYIPPQKRTYTTKKGAQDAHEAVRPTSVTRAPELMKPYLTPDQLKLYRLIWERFLASQMANALIRVTSVEINAQQEAFSALLRASDSKVVFPGYQAVYTEVTEEEEEKPSKLPELAAGEALKLKEVLPKQHFTQPPPRFTEASLVKTLEEKGIGRPSTYAPTIATILDRGYVEKEAKTLKPTELGCQVNDQLVQHFPKIVDVGFTAELENQLDAVEAGEEEWQKLLAEFYKPFQETLKVAAKEMKPVAIPSGENCETCGSPMLIKTGRFGEFLACSNYPQCKTTKPLIKKIGVKCRAEGCTGDIIIKRSRTGKTFYACSRYPDCTFTSWDQPTEQACPKCNAYMVMKRATKTGRPFLLCSNPECKHILNPKKKEKEEEAEA